MTLLAVIATGLCAGLAAAGAAGAMPSLRRPPVRRTWSAPASRLLARAGIDRGPGALVGGSAVLAALTGAVVASATPVAMLAVVPAGIAAAAPTAWVRRRAATRVRAVQQAWPDALAQISGSLRAGRPLSHALIDVSLDGPPALTEPLEGLAARIQTVGLGPALHAVRDALADPVTDRVVEVVVLAHREGGRIVLDVVDDLAASVSAEIVAAEETEALALEGRLNARMVFALPWLVLVLLTARPGPFQDFYAGGAGVAVMAVGAVVSLVGILLVSRLSTTPEEPRVLVEEATP
jgi:tight adherence protein B